MLSPDVQERWNAGAWWGGIVGGGLGWIPLVGGEILLRTGQLWASALALLVAAALAGAAAFLWRVRDGVPPAAGGAVFLLACFPAAVGVFALRELVGLVDFPLQRVWPLLLAAVLLPTLVLLRQRRGSAGPR
jgi:hypothetical protein